MLISFTKDRRGNVAMMMSFALIPIIFVTGMALDRLRIHNAKIQIGEASDAAAVASAKAWLKNQDLTDAQLVLIARDAFENNLSGREYDLSNFVLVHEDGKFTFKVDTNLGAGLTSILTNSAMEFKSQSIANVQMASKLELALVLDNTWSMNGSKMDSLRDAANVMIDRLIVDGDDAVTMALVPFAKYVNVGLSNRSATWLDVEDDYSETKNQCTTTYPDAVSSNCRMETTTCWSDGFSSSCEQEVCDWDYGDPVETCGDQTVNHVWRGCVGSRDYPKNIQDNGYGTKIPGLLDKWCPLEILPLTSDKTLLEDNISAMWAGQDTYIPAGLAWGWRVLSSIAPYDQGENESWMDSNNGEKVLILMTDGKNTLAPNYPTHDLYDQSASDLLTSELCEAIKTDDIRVFTIAFQVTDATTLTLLRDCASNTASFFTPDNASQLGDTFATIANQFAPIWISK